MYRFKSLVPEMGNCVSSHKSTDKKLTVQIQSAADMERNTVKTGQHIAAGHTLMPQTSAVGHVDSFRDSGSKEEAYFDSHPCLDSDCEDYFSVNGDLSPVHQKSFIEAPKLDKIPHMDTASESISKPSPTKQLFELFLEGFDDGPADGYRNLQGQNGTKPTISSPKSTRRSPFNLEPNTGSHSHHRKENSGHSAQCCIPSFMRTLSFPERK